MMPAREEVTVLDIMRYLGMGCQIIKYKNYNSFILSVVYVIMKKQFCIGKCVISIIENIDFSLRKKTKMIMLNINYRILQ